MSLGEQQAQVDFERSLSEGGGEHVFAVTHVAGGAQDGWHLKVVLADSPGTGPTLACGKEVIPCHELENIVPAETDADGQAWLIVVGTHARQIKLRLPTVAKRDSWLGHLRALVPGGTSSHHRAHSTDGKPHRAGSDAREAVRVVAMERAAAAAAAASSGPSFGPSSELGCGDGGDGGGGGGGGGSMESVMRVQAIDPEQYRGLLDAGLIQQKGRRGSGNVFKEHSALVFDCGTGETKVLKLSYSSFGSAAEGTAEAQRGRSHVTVAELCKVPAVLDFLGGKVATLTKDGHSKGTFLELDDAERAALASGALDETLSAADFVRFAREQMARHHCVSSMIGTSAWSRQPRFKRQAAELRESLVRAGIRPTRLTQSAEASYEATAVVYAAEKMGLDGVTGVIGSGGGSVQYLRNLQDAVLLEVGWRVGKARLLKAAAGAVLDELDAWTSEEVRSKLGMLPAADRGLVKGRVVAISACYYAACIPGLGLASPNDAAQFHPVGDALAKMKAKLEELKQQVRDDPTCLQARAGDDKKAKLARGSHAMNLCNLTLQTILYENFFHDECEICFKRGWAFPDGASFTTTWSAGWYLHLLSKQNVLFGDSCRTIIKNLDTVDNDTVVFDCGTGETKALKFSFKPAAADTATADDPGDVVFEEVRKAPAVLDFLKGKVSTDTKDGRPKRAFMDCAGGGAGARGGAGGDGAEEDEEEEETPLSPADFVAFTEQVVERADAKRSIIGTSSWHRTDKEGHAAELVGQLTRAGTVCKKLDNKEEAFFESAAVAYAAQKLGVAGVTGVIGSGGGSVQYVKNFQETRLLEVGWRQGKERLVAADDALAELAAWTAQAVDTQMRLRGEQGEKLTGKVIAISACYYAASIVGIDAASKDDAAVFHPVGVVVAKMKAKLEELKQQVRDDPTCLQARAGDDKQAKSARFSHAMNLCNLTLQTILYENFFEGDACEICFKRNWVLPGGVKFRTTWSAGWYLHYLMKLGITWSESENVLEHMDGVYTMARLEGEKWRAERGKCIGAQQQVAMRLVDLKDITSQMLRRAQRAEAAVTADLARVVEECGGRMDGLDFRLKSEQSLFRKLISKLDRCLQDNTSSPSYTPTVEEITCSVDDCLRYTVVFPFKKYTDGVRRVERYLARKVYGYGSGEQKTNNFANYWHEDKGKTTYMGINSWITTAVDDNAYTWELQFHTEEGIKLKMEESHIQYEIIRAPDDGGEAARERKQRAYDTLKELWEKIPKPPGAAAIGRPEVDAATRIRTESERAASSQRSQRSSRKPSQRNNSVWWPEQQFVIAQYEERLSATSNVTDEDAEDGSSPLDDHDDGADVQGDDDAS